MPTLYNLCKNVYVNIRMELQVIQALCFEVPFLLKQEIIWLVRIQLSHLLLFIVNAVTVLQL